MSESEGVTPSFETGSQILKNAPSAPPRTRSCTADVRLRYASYSGTAEFQTPPVGKMECARSYIIAIQRMDFINRAGHGRRQTTPLRKPRGGLVAF